MRGSMPPFSGGRNRAITTVTNGTNVDASAVRAYRGGDGADVNVNLTATAALGAGATLFTLPSGFRPPTGVTIFGTLINAITETSIRVHVADTGAVTTQVAIGNAVIVRGPIRIPWAS